jgi:hypothetical protein
LTAAALADKAAGGHQLGYLFAAACGAFGLMGTNDQAFKILTALLTVILIDWHSMISLFIRINPPRIKVVHDCIIFFLN